MPNPAPESVPHAIELMTTWLECSEDSPDLLIGRLRTIIGDSSVPGEQLVAATELLMGMTYLNGSLLVLLEHESGVKAREFLQELALQYAQGSTSR